MKIKIFKGLIKSKILNKHWEACHKDITGRPDYNCICGINRSYKEIFFMFLTNTFKKG